MHPEVAADQYRFDLIEHFRIELRFRAEDASQFPDKSCTGLPESGCKSGLVACRRYNLCRGRFELVGLGLPCRSFLLGKRGTVISARRGMKGVYSSLDYLPHR